MCTGTDSHSTGWCVHRHRQSERDASYTPVLKKAADKPAPPNQAIRTIPSGTSSGCHVGWDWAVELLNYAIKQHVAHQVSEIQMRNFVANWALLESVQERLRDLRYQHRAQINLNHFSDVGPDVARLLEIFSKTVGARVSWKRLRRRWGGRLNVWPSSRQSRSRRQRRSS